MRRPYNTGKESLTENSHNAQTSKEVEDSIGVSPVSVLTANVYGKVIIIASLLFSVFEL